MKSSIVLLSIGVIAACSGSALATTRSSFLGVPAITDVTAVPSNGGLTYTVSLGTNPSFTLGGTVYPIADLIGFYALSDDDDLLYSVSNFSAMGGNWNNDSSNSGAGGIAGWRTNPNTGIQAGESIVFNFNSLSTDRVERLGFHVRLTNMLFPGTTGNTGNITLMVPGASAASVFGLAGLAAARRRRRA
ncbi:MAG: hypothetical protein JNK58_14150 [Phycisphaerae bacterium]|nr:hypothetical protein [Phycisphaerae bacterium]